MTAAMWLNTLLYFAFATVAGRTVMRLMRFPRSGLVESWAASYLTGQLILTLLTVLTAFVPLTLTVIFWSLLGILLLYWGVFVRPRAQLLRVAPAAWTVAAVVLVMLAFPNVAVPLHDTPLREWDARSMWFFHGKVIHLHGRVFVPFFVDPLYKWSIPGYPLLLPAQAAWTAFFQGGWNDYSCKSFLLFNFAAYVQLFWLVLRHSRIHWLIGVLLTAVLFDQGTFGYVSGYADHHCAIALVLALAVLSLRSRRRHMPLFVLLLAYAGNAKNEGTGYVILLGALVFAAAMVTIWRRPRMRGVLQPALLRSLLPGIVLFALPVALWWTFKGIHGIHNRYNLVERFGDAGSVLQLLGERSSTIGAWFLDYYSSGAIPMVLATIVLLLILRLRLGRRCVRAAPGCAHGLLLWGAFLAVNCLIFLVFAMTPEDVTWHLRTAGDRLLFLPHILLFLIAVFEVQRLVRLLPPLAGRDSR